MKSLLKYLFLGCFPLVSVAQSNAQLNDGQKHLIEHQWLYGVGHSNVLDTYLSPLTYEGPQLSLWHQSERLARWGKQRVSVQGRYGGNIGFLQTSSDKDKAWDGNIAANVAWLYNWHPTSQMRLSIGPLGGISSGFTYLLKSSNNPAQGRFQIHLGVSALAEQKFHIGNYPLQWRLQIDFPLLGAMFTPNYGQSYYEIFSLGQYDHNIRCIHPFNAPSGNLEATLRLPLWGALLSFGYKADIQQSHVNSLKHHAWNHAFLVGYVRNFQLLRPKRHH